MFGHQDSEPVVFPELAFGITLREHTDVYELKTSIELVSCKIGRTILVLGVMHFSSLITLCSLRDRRIRF